MLFFALSACIGLNPKAVPFQDLYADDGEEKRYDERVRFAVIGETRPMLPNEAGQGRVPVPGATEAFVADIAGAVKTDDLKFTVFMGNMVNASTTGDWKAFSKDWGQLVSGAELNESGNLRVRSLAVPGDRDRVGDDKLSGFGAAFPGIGKDIGVGRVASWYTVDHRVDGVSWRFFVVDSNKTALGSRWEEQLAWLAEAAKGDYSHAIVFTHHPRMTLAKGAESNPEGAVTELIETIEDQAKLGAIKAVFAGHSLSNEVYLPTGRFGEIYVNAGTSGGPAALLARWGHAAAGGFEDLKLEPIFDLTLMKQFELWAEKKAFSESVQEHARAEGSWAGFPGEFDPRYFPISGWWELSLDGPDMQIAFHMLQFDDTVKQVWIADYTPKEGWKTGR